MQCPKCLNRTNVINSREREFYTYRARECPICGYKFSTHEKVYKPIRKYVRKAAKDDSRQSEGRMQVLA